MKGPREAKRHREKQDRKREQKRKRKRERRGGEATAGKSRYVRVTSYAGYTCVRGKADVYVCAVCRNQWKRVEEATWQERTVG